LNLAAKVGKVTTMARKTLLRVIRSGDYETTMSISSKGV
jgi:hypothetical protein